MNAPFAHVEVAFRRHLPGFDLQIPEAVLATRLAQEIEGDPVWLMLVGPASHGKGTTLDPLAEIENTFMLSSITPKTFISGSSGNGDPSLLTRLGARPFIVVKELGTLLESDPKARQAIFAQLREVYDGKISSSFGNGVTREWNGKACVIVGFTNAIDAYSNFDGLLGERFLKIRFRSLEDPATLALKAMRSSGKETKRVSAVRKAYREALDAARKNLKAVKLSDATERRIAYLAAAISTIRTPVQHNPFKKDRIEFTPRAESPARLGKALHAFAKAVAALRGQEDLTDLRLIYRVAFDSVAEPRRSIFANAVRYGDRTTCKDVEGLVQRSQTLAHLEDLCLIGAFDAIQPESDGSPGRPPKRYTLSSSLSALLTESGALPWLLNGDFSADKPRNASSLSD